jgi:hypothetical protein
MLEREYKFYQDNKAELLQRYRGRWIVISEEKIIGDYSTKEEAYKAGEELAGLGNFLMQQVLEDEQIIQRFYSRIYL